MELFFLIFVAFGYFLFRPQNGMVSRTSVLNASDRNHIEVTEVSLSKQKKNRKPFPDVPPPPVLEEVSLDIPDEEEETDSVAVIFVDNVPEESEQEVAKIIPEQSYEKQVLPDC